MRPPALDRRQFLRFAAAGLTLGGVGTLLEACAQIAPGAPAAQAPTAVTAAPTKSSSRGAALPTYVPQTAIKPDVPGSADGMIDSAFINYPANPVRTVTGTPGNGGDVNVTTWTTSAAPTPLDSNSLWQAVNKDLGVNLRINVQPQADYATVKLPTLVAGGELPDILYIATNSAIPQLPAFFKSQCADLTPYLSGDAIKDYPNLANIPPIAWKQVIYNKAITGVPVAYPLYLWVHWVHQNLLDADGLTPPKNIDEYKQLARHFTQPNNNLWGMGIENNVGMGMTNGWVSGIFGVPNIWSLDDKTGKLTAAVETDQFRQGVSWLRDAWDAGIIHPNAMQYNLVSARNDFAVRRFAFRFDGFQAASFLFWDTAPTLDPPAKPRILAPFPAQAGGTPTYWANSGTLGFSVLKQASPDRIKELLRILNYLAAPPGSAEYLLMNYGLKDVHWTPDNNGNPILNGRGKADATVPFKYITSAPVSLYYTRNPDYAHVMQDAERAMLPYMAFNPTDGHYSQTHDNKYASLQLDLGQKLNDIVVGRQPFSALDQAVKDWLDGGGNQMRGEFEEDIAANRT